MILRRAARRARDFGRGLPGGDEVHGEVAGGLGVERRVPDQSGTILECTGGANLTAGALAS